MDVFDKKGLMPAIATLREVESFAAERRNRLIGLPLEGVAGVLERFVQGLNGRGLCTGRVAT